MRILLAAICAAMIFPFTAGAQSPSIVSTVLNNGAAIGVGAIAGSPTNFTPLVAGHFTSASQNLVDVAVMDFQGNFECLGNAGGGTLNPIVVSSVGVVWPVSSIQVLNFGTTDSPATDSIVVITSAGLVTIFSTANCQFTQTAQVSLPGATSVSQFLPGTQTFFVPCTGGIAVEDAALNSTTCQPTTSGNVVLGAFPDGFNIAVVTPGTGEPGPNETAVLSLGTYSAGTFSWLAPYPLEGTTFLGTLFLSNGIEFVSQGGGAGGPQGDLYIQELLVSSALPEDTISVNTIQIVNLPSAAIGMSFSNGVLAFGGGTNVTLFTQNSGELDWTQQETLTASDDISGFAAGTLVSSGETDYVGEFGNSVDQSANIFASIAFSELGTAAPAITSAATTTFTETQAGSFTVTATGTPAPTLSETGGLPVGISFNPSTGVLSGSAASGTAGLYTITFTATNGVGNPAAQTFMLEIASNIVLVGLYVQSQPAADGTVTQNPLPGPQQGCPSVHECYQVGQAVTLTAVPGTGFVFSSWSGACSGSNPVCILTITDSPPTITVNAAWAPAPNFSLSVTPTSVSVSAGSSATAQITATLVNGFSGPILYSCSDTAPMSSCTVTSAGAVTITTKNTANLLPVIIVFLIAGLTLVPTKKRKTGLVVGGLLLLGACGGGSSADVPRGGGTPAGTYSVIVSGQSGSLSHQTSITLVVE